MLLDLEGGNVASDIVTSKWYHSEMAQHVLMEDGDRSGVGTKVDEQTASTTLSLGKDTLGECQRSEEELCDGDACLVEAYINVVVERLTTDDIEEVTLQARCLYTYGIELVLVVYLIFLGDSIENLLFGVVHIAIVIHELIDHVVGDDGIGRQIPVDNIADAADGLTADAHIDMSYLTLELVFELRDDVGKTLGCLVNVVDNALTDALGGVFFDYSQHGDAAVKVFSTGYPRDLGRAKLDCHNEFFCCCHIF